MLPAHHCIFGNLRQVMLEIAPNVFVRSRACVRPRNCFAASWCSPTLNRSRMFEICWFFPVILIGTSCNPSTTLVGPSEQHAWVSIILNATCPLFSLKSADHEHVWSMNVHLSFPQGLGFALCFSLWSRNLFVFPHFVMNHAISECYVHITTLGEYALDMQNYFAKIERLCSPQTSSCSCRSFGVSFAAGTTATLWLLFWIT